MNCPNCGKEKCLLPIGYRSDPYSLYVCVECSAMAEPDRERGGLKVLHSNRIGGVGSA